MTPFHLIICMLVMYIILKLHKPVIDMQIGYFICCTYTIVYEEGDIRLVGKSSQAVGRVEIYHKKEWGTVCSNGWDRNDSMVVCRQLGYMYALKYADARRSDDYVDGTGKIWLDDLNCKGNEDRLVDCDRSKWAENTCYHDQDVGVYCSSEYKGVLTYTCRMNDLHIFLY